MEKKAKDAEAHQKKAEGHLQTSMFKWTPDYTLAAEEYVNAANLFNQCGDAYVMRAKDCFLKAAEIETQHMKSCWFKASSHLEEAGNITVQQNIEDAEEADQYYRQASNLAIDEADITRAAAALFDGAQTIASCCDGEWKRPHDLTLQLYKDACKLIGESERNYRAGEMYEGAIKFCISNDAYIQGAVLLEELASVHRASNQLVIIPRRLVGATICRLAVGDYVAAKQGHEKHVVEDSKYITSAECEACEDLLDAFEKMDQDALDEVVKDRRFLSIENYIVLLLRRLTINGARSRTRPNGKSKNKASKAMVGSSSSGAATRGTTTAPKRQNLTTGRQALFAGAKQNRNEAPAASPSPAPSSATPASDPMVEAKAPDTGMPTEEGSPLVECAPSTSAAIEVPSSSVAGEGAPEQGGDGDGGDGSDDDDDEIDLC